jgi:hypothetical protein
MNQPRDHDAESEPLLISIKARHCELVALLDKVSSHWHAEDKFYRFYHQSWKLFGLQDDTVEIVDALRQLWPERFLHPWFEEIIRDGTNLEFDPDDNRDWLCKGRPILEAFFHSRTMLELAVKYGWGAGPCSTGDARWMGCPAGVVFGPLRVRKRIVFCEYSGPRISAVGDCAEHFPL